MKKRILGLLILITLFISISSVNAEEPLTLDDLWKNIKEIFITGKAVAPGENTVIKPTVSLDYHKHNTQVNNELLLVEGTAKNADKVEVSVNIGDWELAYGSNSWNLAVKLNEGENIIDVKACNNNVCSLVKSINVNYNPSIEVIIKEVEKTEVKKPLPKEEITTTPTTEKDLSDYQWHLHNFGQEIINGIKGKDDADIDAPEAWTLYDSTDGGEGVIIANIGYINDGVDLDHPGMSGKFWVNKEELKDGYNFIDDDDNGYIDDIKGLKREGNHFTDNIDVPQTKVNTYTSSLISYDLNKGFFERSLCPNCKVMVILWDIYYDVGNDSSAIKYAVDKGARVINLLVAADYFFFSSGISYAYNNNVVTIRRSGNLNLDISRTDNGEKLEKSIVVSTTDYNDRPTESTNYGNFVDVAAPGKFVFGLTEDPLCIKVSSEIESGVAASALTASLAGMLISKDPTLKPDEVYSIIKSSADQVFEPNDKYVGIGRINAYKALQMLPIHAVAKLSKNYYKDPIIVIGQDKVPIRGYAYGENFESYEILYSESEENYPTDWQSAGVYFEPVEDDILGYISQSSAKKIRLIVNLNNEKKLVDERLIKIEKREVCDIDYNTFNLINDYSLYKNNKIYYKTPDYDFNKLTIPLYESEEVKNRVDSIEFPKIDTFDSIDYVLTNKFGWKGIADGQFFGPLGIAIDSSENIYVVDSGNRRIQKFDSGGKFIKNIGKAGSGDGEFYIPRYIAIDSFDNLYVTEEGSSMSHTQIQKFNSEGNFILKFGKYGGDGAGGGEFSGPNGIAIDSSGNIYVVDSRHHRVQKFNSNGKFISILGGYGSGDGEFYYPKGIAIDSFDNIYVADSWNHRVQKFDGNGNFINEFGSIGSEDGQFNSPIDIAIDSFNNIYVADLVNLRIQKFDSEGKFILKFSAHQGTDGTFTYPKGIAIDSSDNIYVVDSNNDRVVKFNINGGSYPFSFSYLRNQNSDFNSDTKLSCFKDNVKIAETIFSLEKDNDPPEGGNIDYPSGNYFKDEVTIKAFSGIDYGVGITKVYNPAYFIADVIKVKQNGECNLFTNDRNLSATIFIDKAYSLKTGESVSVNNKIVKLLDVGKGGAILVSVNSVIDIILEGVTKNVNGLEIKNVESYYPEIKTFSSNLINDEEGHNIEAVFSLEKNKCYKFSINVMDELGNIATYTNEKILKSIERQPKPDVQTGQVVKENIQEKNYLTNLFNKFKDIITGKAVAPGENTVIKQPCKDECFNINHNGCIAEGNGYQTCGNYDLDKCLEWSTIRYCNDEETCKNGECTTKTTQEGIIGVEDEPESVKEPAVFYGPTTYILSNDYAEFNIDKNTGLLIQIKDKINNIEYLESPSGLAYNFNGNWHEGYNIPSQSTSNLIEKTDQKIVLQKNEGEFTIIYTYEINSNNLDWITKIKYNGNSEIKDFIARIFFGLDEQIINEYDINPLPSNNYNSYTPYSTIENDAVYVPTLLGGPHHIYFNNQNAGLLMLLKEPIPTGGNKIFSYFQINKPYSIPLIYNLGMLYFDSNNREQEIKLSLALDGDIEEAKKKALNYTEVINNELQGNWYIHHLGQELTDEDILMLKLNNYKFIQIHSWFPRYGVFPSKSETWKTATLNYETNVEEINSLIRRIQDNGMVAFLYFNAAERDKREITRWEGYTIKNKDGTSSKGFWLENDPNNQLYIMSLRDGEYKDYMLNQLSSILDNYEAKGIFMDRNDYQVTPDYNKNINNKYYYDKNVGKPFGSQEYDNFIKEATNMIHAKNKYVILNLVSTINYVPYADGITMESFSLEPFENMNALVLGKPYYILPVNKEDISTFPTWYNQLAPLLNEKNVFYGSDSKIIYDGVYPGMC